MSLFVSKVFISGPVRVSAVLRYFDCALGAAVLTDFRDRTTKSAQSAQVVQNTIATPPSHLLPSA